MTTGENVIVTWENADDILEAWTQLEYYHEGAAAALIREYGGDGISIETIPDAGSRRDDFVEALRYRYGACINLGESTGWHPDKFKTGGKP